MGEGNLAYLKTLTDTPMKDVTNDPATVGEWFQRFLAVRGSDPAVIAQRKAAARGGVVVLNNVDQRAWTFYLEVKRSKGLVIDEA